jgi:hypothetical protein
VQFENKNGDPQQ